MIDDIVYDVTEFAKQHPGGQIPLRDFAGKSCSCELAIPINWESATESPISGQFHQIHSLKTLQKHERLRVGWTEDVPNPCQKPRLQPIKPLWSNEFW